MRINVCMRCMMEQKGHGRFCQYCGFDSASYQPSAHHLPPGTILNGKYLIGIVLGEGGFGITYVGMDLNLQLKVAIKEYFPNGFATRDSSGSYSLTMLSGRRAEIYEKGKAQFLREARRLAAIFGLPGVVTVKDYFQENNTAYIAMEFAEGTTLKQVLKKEGGRMDACRVLTMMRPVMESLGKIHAAGIIHRDISPDNIMVDEDKTVRLIDFGAARSYIGAEDRMSQRVILKPGYSPEEQYRSRGKQGPWTDVYSMCATIYYAITGEVVPEALERQQNDDIRLPSQLGANLKKSQEKALMKGLSVHADDRYQTMQELTAALLPNPIWKNRILLIVASIAIALAAGIGFSVIRNFVDAAVSANTVIEWADTGMEQYVRVALDRPDGEITAGDLKNLKVFRINNSKVVLETDEEKDPGNLKKTDDSAVREIKGNPELFGVVLQSLEDLKWMPELEVLQISCENEVQDCDVLRNLNKLEELNLEDMDITDISALSSLTNLRSLSLYNARITDIHALSKLENLEYLYLGGTDITDVSALSGLKNLKNLYLGSTAITDVSALSGLVNLEYLYLNNTDIVDISPLSGLTSLKKLTLGGTGVIDYSALNGLPNLEELNGEPFEPGTDSADSDTVIVWQDEGMEQYVRVALNRLEGGITIGNLEEIKVFRLYGQKVFIATDSAEDPGSLASSKIQRKDGLQGVEIESLLDLKYMPNLEVLEIANQDIENIEIIGTLESLIKLDLRGSTKLTDISTIGNLVNLRELTLSSCTGITDISSLGNLKNLTDLDLAYCDGITDISVLGSLENLELLDLDSCDGIKDISALGNLMNLRTLFLPDAITDYSALENIPGLHIY